MTAKTYTSSEGLTIGYRIHVPAAATNGTEAVPLVLFLHGAGERGDDNAAHLIHCVPSLLDFIAAGHGFVLFHAASTAWGDWPEFGDLIGLTWQKDPTTGKNISGHGAQHSFLVKMVDKTHPVTQGMGDFQHAKDELYHRQLLHPGARVLATTFSDKALQGSGTDEPMVVVTEPGKGRVFHCAMGHDPRPMQGVGFRTLMLRGTEWAATGKVTIPIPAEWPVPDKAQAADRK